MKENTECMEIFYTEKCQSQSTSRLHALSFIDFDLTECLLSNANIFKYADGVPLLSAAHKIQTSANNLNKDLEKTSKWDSQ